MTTAYPLAWPDGWPRTESWQRKRDLFGTTKMTCSSAGLWREKRAITFAEATKRVREELAKLGVDVASDLVISTNLKLNAACQPSGNQDAPDDTGVAVYWQVKGKPQRVMAVDAYDRVAGNLAAIAATLQAMRSIDRHGGAQILDRAFTGFAALPPPKAWYTILGVAPDATTDQIKTAHTAKARSAHPDVGGSTAHMAELNAARDQGLEARRQCR